MSRALFLLPLLVSLASAQVDHISARALKAHAGFLASDALEGRDTPSAGLEASAEYIAAQFLRIGLEPVNGTYFQPLTLLTGDPEPKNAELTLTSGAAPQRFTAAALEIRTAKPAALDALPAYKLNPAILDSLTPEQINGGVIVLDSGRRDGQSADEGRPKSEALRKLLPQLARLKPAAVLILDGRPKRNFRSRTTVYDAEEFDSQGAPLQITLHDKPFQDVFATLPDGPMKERVSLRSDAPALTVIHPRNIAGLLPGSDPLLKNTYVLVTAHYDHIGHSGFGKVEGDDIWNGANDNASGSAALIETAAALAGETHKRGILFVSVTGEEKGLLGSRWYARHPLEPLKSTVVHINLEQLGRSDGDGGKGAVYLIGYEYTDLPPVFAAAAQANHMELKRSPQDGDQFWLRSDHASLANKGVPATTLMTAFTYPDYHRAGDSADKLDYAELEAAARTAAQAILTLANQDAAPQWNAANPKTAPFIEAAVKLR